MLIEAGPPWERVPDEPCSLAQQKMERKTIDYRPAQKRVEGTAQTTDAYEDVDDPRAIKAGIKAHEKKYES